MAVELVYQASKGHSSMVRKLLENGIHPDACNGNGETALFHAVLAEKLGTAKVLLKYGADPNRCSENGLSPINAACIQDSVIALALLMNYGGRLDNSGKDTKETAIVSALRYRSNRVIKYITKLKKEARLNFKVDEIEDIIDAESFEKKEDKMLTKTEQFPGNFSSLPCIDIEELKTLHEGKKFSFDAPKATFSAGTWNRVPVTVKRLKNIGYAETMKKEMEIMRNLRHQSVIYLLAVITGPADNQISSIFENFTMGSLNHVLYHSKEDLSLFEELHLLVDICNAMVYLHDKDIVHCYINSFSVLMKEKCKAKLGNLEHAQKKDEKAKTDDEGAGEVSHLIEQHPWMCARQLSGNSSSKAGDIYSFGALFWECLTKHVPWSWLVNKSIKQAVVDDCQELPILHEWPENITEILQRCLCPEEDRSDFLFLREHLECLKASGWTIKNDDLDDAFHMWRYGKRKTSFRERTLTGPLASKISWKFSGLSIGSDVQHCEGDSKVLVMCSRRKSSIHANVKHRRNTVDAGLVGTLNVFHQPGKDSRFSKDREKYGVEIAEQLSFVRGIWKTAKLHSRGRWAKDAAVRRKLEGDIERLNVHQSSKAVVEQQKKSNKKKQGRRTRRLSHGAESIAKLRTIAGKYSKWDWARYTTGHAYTLPEEKYEMLSDEEFDDDDKEQVPIDTAGTFVEYQGGRSTEACKIVPSHMHVVGLGKIQESESSEENMDVDSIEDGLFQEGIATESIGEVVQEHWKKEHDEEEQDDTKAKEGIKARNLNDNDSDEKLKDRNHDDSTSCLLGKHSKNHDDIDLKLKKTGQNHNGKVHDASQHHIQDLPKGNVHKKESGSIECSHDAATMIRNDVDLKGNLAKPARDCQTEMVAESVDDGASQFSSDATTFLDEFTDWLDDYYQKNSASSSVSSSLAYREDEATISRNDSRKIFLEGLVEKYDTQLRKQQSSASVDNGEGTVVFRGKSKRASMERLFERCTSKFPRDEECSDKGSSSYRNTNQPPSSSNSKKSFAEDLVGIYDAKSKSHSRTASNSSCVSCNSFVSCSRNESRKSFLEAMVEKYDKQLKQGYSERDQEQC